MKRIWAPWRNKYFEEKHPSGCLFCRFKRSQVREDAKHLVVERSPCHYVMLNRYPYTNGHLMVVSNRHVSSPEQLKDKERLDLLRLLDRSLAALRRIYRPGGFNVGLNIGKAGGAGVPGHMHIHVVPRWLGDTNFMPVINDAKVIPDSLRSVYRRLKKNWGPS